MRKPTAQRDGSSAAAQQPQAEQLSRVLLINVFARQEMRNRQLEEIQTTLSSFRTRSNLQSGGKLGGRQVNSLVKVFDATLKNRENFSYTLKV